MVDLADKAMLVHNCQPQDVIENLDKVMDCWKLMGVIIMVKQKVLFPQIEIMGICVRTHLYHYSCCNDCSLRGYVVCSALIHM